jgi:hypothetical protein
MFPKQKHPAMKRGGMNQTVLAVWFMQPLRLWLCDDA